MEQLSTQRAQQHGLEQPLAALDAFWDANCKGVSLSMCLIMCDLFYEMTEFQSITTMTGTSILLCHFTALHSHFKKSLNYSGISVSGITIPAIPWNQLLSGMTNIPIHLEKRCIVIISVNFLKSNIELYGSSGEHKRLHSAINKYNRYSFTSL